jgi:N-formylglutamate amidohydrolase
VTRRAWRSACAAGILSAALLGLVAARGTAGSYRPGLTYVGRHAYVEFRAGDLPIVISAPHGGSLEPAEIPNRTSATTVTDVATEDLARLVAAALLARTGREPSLVVCKLRRTKIDVNREIGEGAQGNAPAERAWNEYHAFLDAARAAAAARHGRALVVDLHGHGHPKGRIEIGYLIGAADLARPDAGLDNPALALQSSIRTLAAGSGQRFSAIIRGPASLGGLLERAGYPSVPAPSVPKPGTDPYFEGGYITRRHGSADGGPVSAIQLETPFPGLRDTAAARARFAGALADALLAYVSTHLSMRL